MTKSEIRRHKVHIGADCQHVHSSLPQIRHFFTRFFLKISNVADWTVPGPRFRTVSIQVNTAARQARTGPTDTHRYPQVPTGDLLVVHFYFDISFQVWLQLEKKWQFEWSFAPFFHFSVVQLVACS